MNREIQFRVWNVKDHWFFTDPNYPNLRQDGTLDVAFGAYDEFIIQQYTGLKDKNGKKIFEGDIFVLDEGYGGPYVVCFDSQARFGLMTPVDFKSGGYDCFDDLFRWYKFGRIVGNIFENPELLNK